jgi:hypothetical protein
MPAIFFLGLGLTVGTGPSKIPSDTPLGCMLANLEPLWLSPDLKAKNSFFFPMRLGHNTNWTITLNGH